MRQRWDWDELSEHVDLPYRGSLAKQHIRDLSGSQMSVLTIRNGNLSFTVLPERGMDIGEIFLGEEKVSWDRNNDYFLHPDRVNLQESKGTGWLKGFYGAVSSIGPELFGTPGEGYTLHGTGSYSPAFMQSIFVGYDETGITFEGTVTVRGYADIPVFEKRIRMVTHWGSECILREETTRNVSDTEQTLDDGYHIQLSGPFMHEGGRYILPLPRDEMLLRDSAELEEDPLRIPCRSQGATSIRCYQYVPGAVDGLHSIADIGSYVSTFDSRRGITAEMIVNDHRSAAGFVIRPLSCFPRSLIAKEISDSFMFAFEPCRTRPNRMSQKHADGEAFVLSSGLSDTTQCLIGATRDIGKIEVLEQAISQAAIR
ncbi:DUF4432 family protein [Candidatus Pristimantibacillus sp. PTI5]|uniref:DUF4432 family protein n=1 Tax=Candidatus Pristimantibacillus sp. PTI5 TaxID=3400422 RepID=UPI003B01A3DB